MGTSHPSYPLNPQPLVWDVSFPDKSKRLKKRREYQKFHYSKGHILCFKTFGRRSLWRRAFQIRYSLKQKISDLVGNKIFPLQIFRRLRQNGEATRDQGLMQAHKGVSGLSMNTISLEIGRRGF